MTDLLDRAVDELVPRFPDAAPDWADVVERAAVSAPRRIQRRTLAGAVALAAVAVMATPALGVQQYVLHLLGRKDVGFSQSPHAPNVVKKQFLDMPIGAPARWSTPVEAGRARVVGTFTIAGRTRRLWVAPTASRGFCFLFEQSFGGCRLSRTGPSLSVSWQGGPPRRKLDESIVTRVGGDLTAPGARRITARYADGSADDIPFVWVSAPIAAGFFSYDVPTRHWRNASRLLGLTLYANDGRVLGQQSFPHVAPRPPVVPTRVGTPRTRTLPAAPPAPPSAPRQEGTADGFHVVVGHNGSVQFTQIGTTPILEELAGRSVSYGCFRLTREFGIFTVRGLGQEARLAPRAGFTLGGVGVPVDGCEVGSSVGHLWPDRLGNRAAVELAFTAAGRRFFTDRHAARDLALFVRTRRVQRLRREPAAQARSHMLRIYGHSLARSRIRIEIVDRETLRFTERSDTGRLFTVIVHGGRITSRNLAPYALVF